MIDQLQNYNKTFSILITLLVLTLMITACQPAATQAPARYPNQTVMLPDPEQYLTPVDPGPLAGTMVLIDTAVGFWSYDNADVGISLSIPNNWYLVENSDRMGFSIYPPDVIDSETPTAKITVDMIQIPFNRYEPLVDTGYTPYDYSAGGYIGIAYYDSKFAIPTQNMYLEFEHRGGRLFITATTGPYQDLSPALSTMLSYIRFWN